jgi:TP901 family phage tail tape measure protein
MANQARQAIQQVQSQLSALAASTAAGAAGGGRFAGGIAGAGKAMTKFGSQLQWTGRQLTYNFTMPLALAGYAGTKFALDNERAMTRVIKVYGDGSMASTQIKNETDALGRAFEVLSEKYGIARDETIGIAADWAAAGASGASLAKQVQLTMETMILGEMDAATATSSLIAIQAQYGFSTAELSDTIAVLNAVENQTGTTMDDLIQSMSRSAGVARAAGVDVAHLAAMTAALTPAAGSAAQAGNALKTIISRLLSPTGDAQDILGLMNIRLTDMSWKSADADTRLHILSQRFEGLSDAQKGVVSATIASRYQINKFEVLMQAIADDGKEAGTQMSYYYKALQAASDRTKTYNILNAELNAVLDSSPKKMDRIKVMLQNTLADVMQPLLPVIIGIAGAFAKLGKAFNDLNPSTQKLIVFGLLFLAVLGPLVTRIGAVILLFGTLTRFAGFLLRMILPLVGALWGLVSALAGMAFSAVMTGFSGLARVIGAVVPLIAGPVMAAYRVLWGAIVTSSSMMWTMVTVAWTAGIRNISFLARAGMLGTEHCVYAGLQLLVHAEFVRHHAHLGCDWCD